MYTVIGHPRSRTLRVLYALEEMGLDYTLDPQMPRSDRVMALNPSGKIPVLMTDEGPITDSVAIMTYLADRHGQLTHKPGTYARARQDAMTQFLVAEIDAALWTYAKHSFALPEDLRVPEVKPTAQKEFARAIGLVEQMKGEQPFLAGERITLPDLILCQCSGWALRAGFDVPDGAFGDWLKGLARRPAMQRALKQIEALG
ncbi:glutathione S-transferase [Rhodobacteraceae bacterium 2CG4]|uniref:Glutathione S-transferase n=1 Tax=Halovulum marinum TaxID=2662447 RepID=A0A6L5Z3S3_9RHOB|nr:glutathione S-transferase family protein [Halovulum marinum]MSU90662.1 glutathione S-transferase [Halovulum marinum]